MNGAFHRERADARRCAHPLHQAIAASFALDRDGVIERLSEFREAEWNDALVWLDVSGMALYFLDRLDQLDTGCLLPPAIEEGLADRLQRNRARMGRLVEEACAMAHRFQCAGIPYALLKGITLAPDSVPEMVLRSQADLDFLVSAEHRDEAVAQVCATGYQLRVERPRSLEFRAAGFDRPTLARLYSAEAPRALDLHLVSESEQQRRVFARRVLRTVNHASICALAPADILVQQARHLLQHLCSEFTRLCWVLEFRRHVLARKNDSRFWREAAEIACEQENGDLAMAISFWLSRDLFGSLPVELPAQWQAGALPAQVRLWLERYARQVLLSSGIRTKLYALLRNGVPCPAHEKQSTRAVLFPRCFPRPVLDRPPGESAMAKTLRLATEVRFVLLRLRFHLVEGFRLAIEAFRWKRAQAQVGQ